MKRLSKKQKIKNKWISIGIFFLFSLVLFINNFTDLLNKFDIFIQVQWIAWIGLILSSIYTWWLASEDKI